MGNVLITGTDTEIGKTWVTTALFAYGRRYCPDQRWAVFKPIQTGVTPSVEHGVDQERGGDRSHYLRLFDFHQSADEISPLSFQAPLAPPLAAQREERPIDLTPVWQTLQKLQSTYDQVLVEGIGGLGTPITWEWTVADLAAAWKLPILLVVPVRLGAIAQIVANVALARSHQLKIHGIILNCVQPCTELDIQQWAPQDLITDLTHVPILGILPFMTAADDLTATDLDALGQIVAQWPLTSILGKGS
ncbi:dethiobiotin synthase [Candidatus Synechococcus calcipolaris G9]|uniref:ATP-dependent dethiobiotin synthetase BioD n=1 Tax=Candidatus Synechococcus calcipolaris G9 TaxID=1497997 RepID=A0ABT6EX14_9SYNE|nr:dethiobiotin synthase [Candidatus Synechococcus calcipolaris]MDG2990339.1 dethiobiotin synthase [Candidatus Synechococcus calcipolaris G9]